MPDGSPRTFAIFRAQGLRLLGETGEQGAGRAPGRQ
eukprot:CAMPEP_0180052732 /NCGR_PEP_ID=MMETSP0985-20121206/1890_1 /TAXON_ID=483367 /ORGANISM="non described non described, Strain CCMP 2436" /LENGTH=35 /DNA_ID= /DNA_START= /DNA_END= /DNA_ORIENTATION=